METARRENYDSGEDFVLEYGELRFTFNEEDFRERCEQAALKLGFVGGRLGEVPLSAPPGVALEPEDGVGLDRVAQPHDTLLFGNEALEQVADLGPGMVPGPGRDRAQGRLGDCSPRLPRIRTCGFPASGSSGHGFTT